MHVHHVSMRKRDKYSCVHSIVMIVMNYLFLALIDATVLCILISVYE